MTSFLVFLATGLVRTLFCSGIAGFETQPNLYHCGGVFARYLATDTLPTLNYAKTLVFMVTWVWMGLMIKMVNVLFIVEVHLSSLASLQALHPKTVI